MPLKARSQKKKGLAIMNSKFILTQGVGQKLEFAINRNGGTTTHVEWLSAGENFKSVMLLASGEAKLIMKVKPVSDPVPPVDPTAKFSLLVDLGIITVPDDYDHATWLARFQEKHQGGKKKSFYLYNDEITDANFPNPTRILKPGDKLRIRVFKQIIDGTTTSEERMAFLATQKAVHTGAQGASLVFEQKHKQLPKGKWYASFDEKERLLRSADGRHRVPLVDCCSDGDFRFCLGFFEGVWFDDAAFFCLCDLESEPLVA